MPFAYAVYGPSPLRSSRAAFLAVPVVPSQSAEIAADNGIISRSNKKFRPQDTVTLMEATAILTKSIGFKYTKNTASLRIGE